MARQFHVPVALTAASTAPLRSHSAVWSWSSTATCSSTGCSAPKAAMAGALVCAAQGLASA